MKPPSVTVHLMGGLGNQMFQYAYGAAIATHNKALLRLDSISGFKRDRVFKRNFELSDFGLQTQQATSWDLGVYELERALGKFRSRKNEIESRLWGTSVHESSLNYSRDLHDLKISGSTFVKGYFQTEKYFAKIKESIHLELSPRPPKDSNYLRLADEMRRENSVAVGVRLFEEVPESSRNDVTEFSFYRAACSRVAESDDNKVFYVFCTKRFPALETLNLPGEVRYITHDDGFEGSAKRLWLFSQCRSFVVSHSSFYWWGAWLGEARSESTQVVASKAFPGDSTIPARWIAI